MEITEYYSKVLYPFVNRLIQDNKVYSFSGCTVDVNKIDETERYEFAMHLIENDERDLFSIYQNEKIDDIVCSLLRVLKNDLLSNKINLANEIMEKIVNYYKPKMQSIIDEILSFEKKLEICA